MTPEQFTALYREFLSPISKYLVRRVHPSEVEDLASKIFEIAWSKRESVPKGYELAWLYKIAGYVVANHRRKKVNQFNLIERLSADSAPSAEEIAIRDLALAEAWSQLSKKDREAISLVTFDGLDNKQAAKVLDISTNAFTVRVSKARAKLRSYLA